MADGKIVGWFHGRTEYGPRALGARSIIGDPRNPRMQSDLNLKIKFRESFRPFAPCVLREHVHEWFADAARRGLALHAPGRAGAGATAACPSTEERRDTLRRDPDLAAARQRRRAAPSRRSPTSTTAPASRRSTSGTAGSTA